MPSIAAFEERAGCGARQLASGWSAGRRRAPRKDPRPGDPPPPSERTWVPESWRGSADRKAGPGSFATSPAPPGAPTPLFEGKGKAGCGPTPGPKYLRTGAAERWLNVRGTDLVRRRARSDLLFLADGGSLFPRLHRNDL